MISREVVNQVINEERDYQDQMWPHPEHDHTLTEYLVYIRSYVERGLEAVSHSNGDEHLLDNIRKIAALAVAAMEYHGVSHRGYPFIKGPFIAYADSPKIELPVEQ